MNSLAGYELRLKKAEEKLESRKKDNDDTKLLLLSAESRLKFLQDTEKNMEGYQGSVKAVLKEYSRGTLTGIHGTLSSLIEVKEKYQTAVETALGNAIQDIVTDTENDAKRAINFLKENRQGRATFLPISAGSISIWMTCAFGAKLARFPVNRSSNRAPIFSNTSQSQIAVFAV